MSRAPLVLLLALLVSGALAGAAPGTPAAPKRPIVIGTSISLTGASAATASYVLQGYQRWVGDANAHGGLLGQPVKLLVYDDRSDPKTAPDLYRRLIVEDKVDLVAGPHASAITQAVVPVTEELRRVMVGQTAAGGLYAGTRWNVQGYPTGDRYLRGLADLAARRGYQTLALISSDAPGTLEICSGLRARAETNGLKVVLEATYPRTATDLSAAASAAQASAADVVVGCSFLSDSIALARDLDESGAKPKLLAFSIGPTDPSFGTSLGAAAERVVGSTTWWPTLATRGNAAFVESFTRTFDRAPTYHAAAAYAGLQVLAAAVRRVGSLDQAKLRAEIGKLRLQTVAGLFRVDRSGRQLGYESYLMQWQSGRQRLVWPPKVAEAAVLLPYR